MNDLVDEFDPDGAALFKKGLYIKRRRKLYCESQHRRWLCQRELEALEAGHDDVSKLARRRSLLPIVMKLSCFMTNRRRKMKASGDGSCCSSRLAFVSGLSPNGIVITSIVWVL